MILIDLMYLLNILFPKVALPQLITESSLKYHFIVNSLAILRLIGVCSFIKLGKGAAMDFQNFRPYAVPVAFLVIVFILIGSDTASEVAVIEVQNVEHVVDVLMGLFLVALFMERAQEVFITSWRDAGRTSLESEVQDHLSALELEPNDLEVMQALKDAQGELAKYKAGTQKGAYLFGLAIGLAIAVAGIRSLSHVISHENLSGFQESLFYFLDVALTAALVAGGSDALHKLVSVFTDAMDASRKKVQAMTPKS